MADFKKLGKGLTSAIKQAEVSAASKLKGTQDVLPKAEREANLQKFLEPSKTPMRLYHQAKRAHLALVYTQPLTPHTQAVTRAFLMTRRLR